MVGAAQYVQDEKIQISRRTITAAQYRGSWPDEYNSFVTSETRNNQYKDPGKFFATMKRHPEWYSRKFIFRPLYDTSDIIKEASLYANRIIHQQSRTYGVRSGFYGSSFEMRINGALANSMAQLDNMDGDSVVTFLNTAAYAATVESNALNIAKIGGVLFYAAKMVGKKYPQLGVRFVFTPAQYVQGAEHKYSVPTLSIGPRTRVVDKLTRPGKNRRRRSSLKRYKARLQRRADLRQAER